MKEIKYYNFDFDDNIIKMPTKIILFHKNNVKKELALTTDDYALLRTKVGKSGIVKNYRHSFDFKNGVCGKMDYSFREFRDNYDKKDKKEEVFITDLKYAIKHKHFSTSWNDFVEALSTVSGAKRTTIITARGQSPRTIRKGLLLLQKEGLIKNVPPLKNIYAVSHPSIIKKFHGGKNTSAANPSEIKKRILCQIIEKINQRAKRSKSKYTCGFSDDDKKTCQLIKKIIKSKLHLWKNIEISLFFTEKEKVSII